MWLYSDPSSKLWNGLTNLLLEVRLTLTNIRGQLSQIFLGRNRSVKCFLNRSGLFPCMQKVCYLVNDTYFSNYSSYLRTCDLVYNGYASRSWKVLWWAEFHFYFSYFFWCRLIPLFCLQKLFVSFRGFYHVLTATWSTLVAFKSVGSHVKAVNFCRNVQISCLGPLEMFCTIVISILPLSLVRVVINAALLFKLLIFS